MIQLRETVDNIIVFSKGLLNDKKYSRILRFCITGGINTLIDFLTFTILICFGFYFAVSQAAGYLIGTLNSYILNKFWTFGDSKTGKKTSKELIQFTIINIMSFSAALFGMILLKNNFGLNVYIAKILTIFIGQLVNFVGYRFWVFDK